MAQARNPGQDFQYINSSQIPTENTFSPDSMYFNGSGGSSSAVGVLVNVVDYGAMGDGVTDDTQAFNDALDAVRDAIAITYNPAGFGVGLTIPAGVYRIDGSINATGIVSVKWLIDGNGSMLVGHGTGKIVLDLFGSRFFTVRNLHIYGDATDTPSIAIAHGIVHTVNPSVGDSIFEDVSSNGYFDLCNYYSFCAETVTHIKWRHFNKSVVAGSYCAIMDSKNTQGVESDYITQENPVDTNQSFNDQLFVQADYRKENGGTPLLMVGDTMSHHNYLNSYMVSVDGPIIKLEDCLVLKNCNFDIHAETTDATEWMVIDNETPASAPIITGCRFEDHDPQVATSLFDLTGTTRQVVFDTCEWNFGKHAGTPPLFGATGATPSKILASGVIKWADADSLDITNCQFCGTIFTENGTTVTSAAGSYHIIRRPSTTAARTDYLKGSLKIAGTPDGTDETVWIQMTGGAAGGTALIEAGGETDVDLRLKAAGSGGIVIGKDTATSLFTVYADNSSTAPMYTVEQDGTGDATFQWLLTATRAWVGGIDNSDADAWKLSPANDAFAGAVLRIGTDGAVRLLLSGVPTYADDTDAGGGGLVAGDVYKTSAGALMIKL